jgi:MSHA biogenesis protein MshJ
MNKLLVDNVDKVVEWLNARDERERLGILALGCVCISMLWYFMLQKPLILKRMQIQQQTASIQKQTLFLDNEANNILIQATKNATHKKLVENENEQFESLNRHFASSQGTDELVKAILNPMNPIRIMDLKNIVTVTVKPDLTKPDASKSATPDQDGYQVVFQSDYINAVTYLESLEKLPWCLSWDSLEYTVMSYPNAQVAVTLHIVSA